MYFTNIISPPKFPSHSVSIHFSSELTDNSVKNPIQSTMSTALFINVSISAFHNVTGISQENYFPLKLSSYHLIIRTKAVLKIMAINCYCLNSRINQLSVPSPKSPHYAHVVTLFLLTHHSCRPQLPRSFTQYTGFSSPSIHRLSSSHCLLLHTTTQTGSSVLHRFHRLTTLIIHRSFTVSFQD